MRWPFVLRSTFEALKCSKQEDSFNHQRQMSELKRLIDVERATLDELSKKILAINIAPKPQDPGRYMVQIVTPMETMAMLKHSGRYALDAVAASVARSVAHGLREVKF